MERANARNINNKNRGGSEVKVWDNAQTLISGSVIVALVYLVGGLDNVFMALALFMAMDYISGVALAFKEGRANSQVGFWGIAKKTLMLFFVIIAVQLDGIANSPGYLRNAVLFFLIANEGISILENLGHLGLPVPPFILGALQKYNDKSNISNTSKFGGENSG